LDFQDKLSKLRDIILSNEIITKSTSAFLFKIIGSVLGYLFLMLVTRIYGSEIWGIFALCLAILNISTSISKFGIDIAILKFVAQFQDFSIVKRIYFQCIFLVSVFSIVISFSVFYFSDDIAIYFFNKPHIASSVRLIALAIFPFSILKINAQTFRGLKRIKEFAFFEYVSKFLFAIIFFLFLLKFTTIQQLNFPIYSFLYSVLLVWLISSVYLIYDFKSIRIKKVISNKKILETAYPMLFSTSIFVLMSWSDTIMLGIFTSESNVGLYNVALKLAMSSVIILGAVNSILAPKLSETYNNNKFDSFKQLIQQSTRIIFLCTLPILLVLLIFPELCLSFFGTEFIVAKNTLMILLLGQFVNVFSGSVGFVLQMTGNEKVFQKILFYSLIINILLNYFLIPLFDINGAAIASVLSMVIWNLSSVIYVYKKYNVLTVFNFGSSKK
tara:strand:- start:8419 stop:9744 length:1326 start_codon:yes stop_codon:yes gene_type:complete